MSLAAALKGACGCGRRGAEPGEAAARARCKTLQPCLAPAGRVRAGDVRGADHAARAGHGVGGRRAPAQRGRGRSAAAWPRRPAPRRDWRALQPRAGARARPGPTPAARSACGGRGPAVLLRRCCAPRGVVGGHCCMQCTVWRTAQSLPGPPALARCICASKLTGSARARRCCRRASTTATRTRVRPRARPAGTACCVAGASQNLSALGSACVQPRRLRHPGLLRAMRCCSTTSP